MKKRILVTLLVAVSLTLNPASPSSGAVSSYNETLRPNYTYSSNSTDFTVYPNNSNSATPGSVAQFNGWIGENATYPSLHNYVSDRSDNTRLRVNRTGVTSWATFNLTKPLYTGITITSANLSYVWNTASGNAFSSGIWYRGTYKSLAGNSSVSNKYTSTYNLFTTFGFDAQNFTEQDVKNLAPVMALSTNNTNCYVTEIYLDIAYTVGGNVPSVTALSAVMTGANSVNLTSYVWNNPAPGTIQQGIVLTDNVGSYYQSAYGGNANAVNITTGLYQANTTFTHSFTGLVTGTRYWWYGWAQTLYGQNSSAWSTFQFGNVSDNLTSAINANTFAPPVVVATEATRVGGSHATINGLALANNFTISSVGFVWWSTADNVTKNVTFVGPYTVSTNKTFSYNLTGLSANQTYNYYFTATNGFGTANTSNVVFKTLTGYPTIRVDGVQVLGTAVNLTATVSALNGNTLGFTGFAVSKNNSTFDMYPYKLTTNGSFTVRLKDLEANTLYYYKAFAQGDNGFSYTAVANFTTNVSGVPHMSTLNVSASTYLTLTLNGRINLNNGSNITAHGFELSLKENEWDDNTWVTQYVNPGYLADGTTYSITTTPIPWSYQFPVVYYRAIAYNANGYGVGGVWWYNMQTGAQGGTENSTSFTSGLPGGYIDETPDTNNTPGLPDVGEDIAIKIQRLREQTGTAGVAGGLAITLVACVAVFFIFYKHKTLRAWLTGVTFCLCSVVGLVPLVLLVSIVVVGALIATVFVVRGGRKGAEA